MCDYLIYNNNELGVGMDGMQIPAKKEFYVININDNLALIDVPTLFTKTCTAVLLLTREYTCRHLYVYETYYEFENNTSFISYRIVVQQ